jgi:hypothetical protein
MMSDWMRRAGAALALFLVLAVSALAWGQDSAPTGDPAAPAGDPAAPAGDPATPGPTAPPAAPALLVLPLVPEGMDDPTTAAQLSDLLLSDARSSLGAAVAPIGADEAAGCASVDCAVAFGRARGAAEVLFGRLVRFGESLSLSIYRADVAEGAVVATFGDVVAISTERGQTDAALLKALRTASAEVLRPVLPAPAPAPAAKRSQSPEERWVAEELAQRAREAAARQAGRHRHDGFFLRMALGVAGGYGTADARYGEVADTFTWRGVGPVFDLAIGGAVVEDLLLQVELASVILPTASFERESGTADGDGDLRGFSFVVGLGVTYYFMPLNLYVSGSFGIGRHGIDAKREYDGDDEYATIVTSEMGFGMALAAGKEWFVSDNWGLGVSALLLYTAGPSDFEDARTGDPLEPRGWGHAVSGGVLLSATYN